MLLPGVFRSAGREAAHEPLVKANETVTSWKWVRGLCAACGLLSACGAPPPLEDASVGALPAYVGSGACAGCHRAAYEAWLGSHHQLAMQPATGAAVAGDFADATYIHGAERTGFSRSDGRFMVRTGGPGADAADFEVRFAFGVAPLQQYLLALPGGRLQAFDIAWDTVEGRWFHLQPEQGAERGGPLHWSGRAYTWNLMCADCHSTGVTKGYDAARRTYATSFAEVSVGCEACHGPGSAHLDWANRVATGQASDASRGLPELGRGVLGLDTQAEQINSCAPCHSRRTQLREGFTPDKPFFDYYLPALLEPGLYEADGQILDEVYVYGSFLQSRMHTRGVACGDCHEPHSARLLAEGDRLCTRCHNAGGDPRFPTLKAADYDTVGHHLHDAASDGARCVSCHMPARTYMLVDDRRDHGFRIPRPDLTTTAGVPNACNGCHEERSAEWARAVLARHFGTPEKTHFAPLFAAARRAQPSVAAALAAVGENRDETAMVRATALALMHAYDDAGTGLALEGGLRDASPLVRLGALRGAARFAPQRFWRRANHLLDDERLAVRTEAARLLAAVSNSLGETEQRRLLETLNEYLATQRFNADWPEAHTNMASAYTAIGDLPNAEAALGTALELAADWVPAMVNLADLYRATGRDRAAGELLDRALALAPGSPEVKLARALWLVRQGRDGEALPLLKAAAGLAPDNPRYAYAYAIALHSSGQSERALDILHAALRHRPGHRELTGAASAIARQLGDDARMND